MPKRQPLTTPDHSVTGMPGGVPYIIGNEAAERFSFYGMKAILVVFMTQYLVDATGNDATLGDEEAKSIYHLFVAAAYFTPMIGALISDIFLGKYKTILFISLMYCLGHGMLALMDVGPHFGVWDMQPFLYSGLFLIALGSGGIKPCVSAHVGDQFGRGNKHLMTQIFNWFYFSINVGAAASQLLTPWLLKAYGPWLAFGLPGALMAIATFVFWLGRHQFIHIPPAGFEKFVKETFSPQGIRALLNLSPLFLLFVPMFWAIFDQTGSAWVLQADQMNRDFGIIWLPSQIQFVNPVMILLGIPIFTYLIYPLMGKFFKVTPLRKIGIGLTLTSFSFFISAWVQIPIDAKQQGIATTLYNDLAADLQAGELGTAATPGSVSRATLGAASGSLWTEAQVQVQTGLSIPTLAVRVEEGGMPKLIASDKWNEMRSALSLAPLTKDADRAAYAATIAAAAEAGWTAEQFAEYDLTTLDVARRVSDEDLGALLPASPAAEVLRTLASSTDEEGKPVSDLAAAVKTARVVWLMEATTPGGKDQPDKDRIVGYLEEMPNIFWQFLAYLVLTSAEIMVSIVCLEFAYSQSPTKMKSFIMGVYFLGVSLGNIFVSIVNAVIGGIEKSTGTNPLEGANYYWFFGGLMLVTSVIYMIWSPFYKGETFIQGDDHHDPDGGPSDEGPDELEEAKSKALGTEPAG